MGLATYVLSPGEPVYQGRRLTEWLRDLREAPPATAEGAARQAAATDAVRRIGVKALPTLLALARARPAGSGLRGWMARLQGRARFVQFNWRYGKGPPPGLREKLLLALAGSGSAFLRSPLLVGQDDSWLAAKGFIALGPLAEPAIPDLARMLTNNATSQEAAICLIAIGPVAAPALTNANASLRRAAAEALPIRLRQ